MTDSLALDLSDVGQRIEAAQRIVMASHLRPDGDAIGSLIALGDSLEGIGKDILLLNQDTIPSTLEFLPETGRVRKPEDLSTIPAKADLVIILDTSSEDRVGEEVWEVVPRNVPALLIDHHITNTCYGTLHHVDAESPATGQIIYELIELMGWPLSDCARQNLWVAINTDTGSFQYNSTTARTFEIAADLVRQGVDVGAMSERLYQNYPARRLQLLGRLLPTLELRAGGRLASWCMKAGDLEELQVAPGDTEGLIDQLRSIEGVVVAVSFEESPAHDSIRVSARSKDADIADVAAICSRFGGGGHQLAAGATLHGDLQQATEEFLQTATRMIEDGSD